MTFFTIQTDTVRFSRKPTGDDVALMKKRMASQTPKTIDIKQFADLVTSGYSYCSGVLKGGAGAENWTSQQLFCLDIDNEDKTTKHIKQRAENPLTVPDILKRCNSAGVKPSLIYETFSSSPNWQRFRIAFLMDRLTEDGEERDRVQKALIGLFHECDAVCTNRDRLFYGGKKISFIDENAVNNYETLDNLYKNTVKKNESKVKPKKIRQQTSNSGELDELKQSFDFLGYIRSEFGGTEKSRGRYIVFNPCPICGHKDDFVFYSDTNSFKCFSTNGNVGGSIIDFLMYTRNIGKKQAVHTFMHELCGIPEKKKYSISIGNKQEKKSDLPPFVYWDSVNRSTGMPVYKISCPKLAEYIRQAEHYIFVRNKALDGVRRYWYSDGCYRLISDDELKGRIKSYITAYNPILLKMKDVNEVFNDLITDCNFYGESDLNADEMLINFRNGLLDLRTLELKPHTPDFISTVQMPCNWNPQAKESPVFDKFLDVFTDGNEEKKTFLLQYMGVIISNVKGWRMKKALFMYGNGDTGKSQLKGLTERLLGRENYCPVDLSDLEGNRFSTSGLYGKRLAGNADMSYCTVGELKIFKRITGGDDILFEAKYNPAFSGKFNGLLWFGANELPKFGGDRGNWVYNRIIPFHCPNVIPPEKQDKTLLDKMFAEREAIVCKCVESARKVVENGFRFDIPNECTAELEKYKVNNSPCLQFFEECCIMRPDDKIRDKCGTSRIHKAFGEWCKANTSRYVPTPQAFRREVAQYIGVTENAMVKTMHGVRYYIFTLTDEAKQEYHFTDSMD